MTLKKRVFISFCFGLGISSWVFCAHYFGGSPISPLTFTATFGFMVFWMLLYNLTSGLMKDLQEIFLTQERVDEVLTSEAKCLQIEFYKHLHVQERVRDISRFRKSAKLLKEAEKKFMKKVNTARGAGYYVKKSYKDYLETENGQTPTLSEDPLTSSC